VVHSVVDVAAVPGFHGAAGAACRTRARSASRHCPRRFPTPLITCCSASGVVVGDVGENVIDAWRPSRRQARFS